MLTRRRERRWRRWRNREARRYALSTRRDSAGDAFVLSAADVRDLLGVVHEWQPGADREGCGGPRTKGAKSVFQPMRGCGCDSCESGWCCGWAPPPLSYGYASAEWP